MFRKNIHSSNSRQHPSLKVLAYAVLLIFNLQFSIFNLTACSPEPPLHLYDAQELEFKQPIIDLDLKVYWNYDSELGLDYDWQSEWYYGWDEEDRRLWGELGYTTPTIFNLRRYYTGEDPHASHTGVIANTVEGDHFSGRYDWGFWDLLVWNRIVTLDGVQSLIFDEQTSLDSVTAFTNPSMHPSRYNAPRYSHAFYAPEPLFAAYEEDIEVNSNLDGFNYDPVRDVYYRELQMVLRPITYIYLTQIILHNNKGRIAAIDGASNLSGMGRTTNLNTGQAGNDAVSVYYGVRMKRDTPLVPYSMTAGEKAGSQEAKEAVEKAERVDIVGGRLMTFGICGQKANDISRASEVNDRNRHYLDVSMQFNNGVDSLFAFDVTDQVRRRYKGGVITVELDLDTVPIPSRRGGSGFNAVVLEPDTVTHIIEM